jgi:hypothetical protein
MDQICAPGLFYIQELSQIFSKYYTFVSGLKIHSRKLFGFTVSTICMSGVHAGI